MAIDAGGAGGAARRSTAGLQSADAFLAADPRGDGDLLTLVRSRPARDADRERACEVLVARHRGLVRSCVRRYLRSPENAEDLMQVGYVGLLKAINNFDPAVGGSLAAYAQPCICGEIKRHFRDKRWQVRVERPVQELVLEVREATRELSQQLGHQPADAELAGHLGRTEAQVRQARAADLVFSPASLDAPIGADGADGGRLADMLGQDDPGMEHALDMQALAAHWGELPRREQKILLMRFYGDMTQAQIGAQLGISQMHVSRLLTHALTYLRHRITTDVPPPPSHTLPAAS
ncbi:MAG TPA: sigma-70 family RNA polymerase sigma factor [Streptosporangiaceae bacterium]